MMMWTIDLGSHEAGDCFICNLFQCMAYASAYCRTILDGYMHVGTKYWQTGVGGRRHKFYVLRYNG